MLKAAGTIFLSQTTGRVLLNYRSQSVSSPHVWGFWGGKIHSNEKILDGLSREVIEELGFIPEYKRIIILDEYKSPDKEFIYYSFLVVVNDEFIPHLNDESDGYGWFNIGAYPKDLHVGAKKILLNKALIQTLKKISKEK